MKPTGPIARRSDYEIRDCPLVEAAALIRAEHYAGGCSKTSVYCHGLYRDDHLVGAALWLPPTKVCAQTVHDNWRRVLSLSRFVCSETEPTNAESLFLGACIRRIKRDRKWIALVTYADQAEGHSGMIYRATNWQYIGETRPLERWVDQWGRLVSVKTGPKTRSRAEMFALGFRSLGKSKKHKFIMVLS